MSKISLEDMHLFVCVAELKSFTAASDKANVPKSTISRRLRALEDHLAVRLLERTTRTTQLTEEGRLFYQRCILVLNEVEITQQQLSQANTSPSGLLRIYAPTEFSRKSFVEIIPRFAKRYPEIKLDIRSGTIGQHLLEDRIDIIIHIDEPEDSSFVAKPIATATTNYYASKEYIDAYGEPQTPNDLLQHKCIIEVRNPTKAVTLWTFKDAEHNISLDIKGDYHADSSFLCLAMVASGLGVGMLPDHICNELLAEGKLQKLFNGRYQINHTLYAVHPSRRYPPQRVKLFLDFLASELQQAL